MQASMGNAYGWSGAEDWQGYDDYSGSAGAGLQIELVLVNVWPSTCATNDICLMRV